MCAICQLRIQNMEEVVELRCQHLYHKECARPWVLERKKCPTCRMRQFMSKEEGEAANADGQQRDDQEHDSSEEDEDDF